MSTKIVQSYQSGSSFPVGKKLLMHIHGGVGPGSLPGIREGVVSLTHKGGPRRNGAAEAYPFFLNANANIKYLTDSIF